MHRALAELILSFSRGVEKSTRPEDRVLIKSYMAELAPLLARATVGEKILSDLQTIERMFGHGWVVDPEPFEDAFEKWRVFRQEYERWAMSGMTVNERLHSVGLLDAFDRVYRSGDREQARQLLQRVHLSEADIRAVLKGL